MRYQLATLFIALFASFGQTVSAESESGQGRIRASALEEAELAQASLAVAFVESRTEIGSAGSGRTVEDAGSGVLVTPCHIMTARHVLGPKPSGGSEETRSFTVSLPATVDVGGTVSGFSSQKATLAVEGGQRRTRRNALLDDWAFLELQVPVLGNRTVKVFDQTCCTPRALRAALAGFPIDKSDTASPEMWIDPECAVIEKLANRMIAIDCEATSGNSGGPLMVLKEDGWRLAAILTRAPSPGAKGSGVGFEKFAIPVDRFLKRQIAGLEDDCARRLKAGSKSGN
jgi:V8-like Glu-specific endopeptidase